MVESSIACISCSRTIEKLQLVIREKNEEIIKLQNVIANLRETISGGGVDHGIDEKATASEEVEKTLPSTCIISKETLFMGANRDDIPSVNDVVQIHYTIVLCPSITHGVYDDCDEIMVEDSRERRKGRPFEFILGRSQVVKDWEIIIQEMSRGEVVSVKMKNDSNSTSGFLPSSKMKDSTFCLLDAKDSNDFFDVLRIRIELIDFWKYEEPLRPCIIEL